MSDQYSRTEMIIGSDAVEILKASSVIIFGIGGVGSYVVEGLARAGVGNLTLVDNDVVDITNINRQIPALHSTIGKSKAAVMTSIRIAMWMPGSVSLCRIRQILLILRNTTMW